MSLWESGKHNLRLAEGAGDRDRTGTYDDCLPFACGFRHPSILRPVRLSVDRSIDRSMVGDHHLPNWQGKCTRRNIDWMESPKAALLVCCFQVQAHECYLGKDSGDRSLWFSTEYSYPYTTPVWPSASAAVVATSRIFNQFKVVMALYFEVEEWTWAYIMIYIGTMHNGCGKCNSWSNSFMHVFTNKYLIS